jgi:hypothetical protein
MTDLDVKSLKLAAPMTSTISELTDEQIDMASGAGVRQIWAEVKNTASDVWDAFVG